MIAQFEGLSQGTRQPSCRAYNKSSNIDDRKKKKFLVLLLNAALFARMTVTTSFTDDVSSIAAVQTRAETSGTKSGRRVRPTVGHGSGRYVRLWISPCSRSRCWCCRCWRPGRQCWRGGTVSVHQILNLF
jgi:hypothetical protein